MKRADPYLNFPGNTLEAFEHYRSVFGGEFAGVFRFRDFGGSGMGVPDEDLDKIAHIALPLGESLLMGTDSLESLGQSIRMGNNGYIHIETDSPEEAERIFNGLSQGGKVEMALAPQAWAEKYGACADRFGVQWMVSYTGNVSLG